MVSEELEETHKPTIPMSIRSSRAAAIHDVAGTLTHASTERLMGFLMRPGRDVEIILRPARRSERARALFDDG
jgi:hypothetical protein